MGQRPGIPKGVGHKEAGKTNEKARLMVEKGDAASFQDAVFILEAKESRRKAVKGLLAGERSWRLNPETKGEPTRMSKFAQRREAYIAHEVRRRLDIHEQEALSAGKAAYSNPAEYRRRYQEEYQRVKYFPVLLISAPHVEPGQHGGFMGEPTPLMYAASVLERHLRIDEFPSMRTPDIKAMLNPPVYDEDFKRTLSELVSTHRPHVVGISNISEGHHYALEIARIVKDLSPESIIIFGGTHEDGTNPQIYRRYSKKEGKGANKFTETAADRMEGLRTLATPEERALVDFVVSGDAPYLFMRLMKIIADHPDASGEALKKAVWSQRRNFRRLRGSGDLFFHDSERGKIQDVRISGVPLDHNHLPFLFRQRLSHENRYPVFDNKKTAQVMTCDGCIESCSYCYESARHALAGIPKLLPRTPENVIKELELLWEQDFRAIFFDDSNFAQNHRTTSDLLGRMTRMAQEGKRLEWGCQTTITSVEPDKRPGLLRRMAGAGCTYVYFGLEQAEPMATPDIAKAQRSLTVYQKPWDQIFEEVCRECKAAGIRVGCSLLFSQGETMEQWKKTIALVKKMYQEGCIAPRSVALNISTPYPESKKWLELLDDPTKQLPDYRKKPERNQKLETALEFSELPLETAQEIYSMAHSELGDALVGVYASPPETT